MLAVFLTIFGIVPIVFILLFGRHRSHNSNVSLQECPHCGAENQKAKERCYCCGYSFVPPQPYDTNAELIRRVKLADDTRMRREAETRASRPVEDTS